MGYTDIFHLHFWNVWMYFDIIIVNMGPIVYRIIVTEILTSTVPSLFS